MATNYDDKGPINLVCPRCSGMIPNNENPGAYPGALSRYDSATEVCSQCCSDEAMIQFATFSEGIDAKEAVHPVRGEVKWVTIPGTVI